MQLVLIAGAFIACVISVTFWRLNALHKADAELTAANYEYQTKWATIGGTLEAKRAAVDALKTRLGVITDLLAGRSLYPHFMADMAHAMPLDISVSNITTTRSPNSLKVSAQATSSTAPGITRWVRIMQKPGIFGDFGEPDISTISAADDTATNGKKYTFTISFVYTPRS